MRKLYVLIAALLLAAPVVSSCGSASKTTETTSKENVVRTPSTVRNRILSMGRSHPEGFTLDVHTMEEPKTGIAVAYSETKGIRGGRDIYKVTAHAYSHDGYVGGWKDKESGKYYYESVKLFPEDDLEEAMKFARENGQKSVYILSSETEVPVQD